ncbi:cytochrome P450 [Bradyrhizobium sp. BR13661]|jgi:cytochrome P450|uniref:cytochrome P450 n=1 Tax=Bradyrhizobium sp. BR13661 TaxID=2940622 RepID=UPI0024740BED|nr:cytochrome P450 [Bradyrhizobium sp. BR13661]MDH6261733.1 cytochrome P450 [Bradyrhizobium sp. BR13661]
MTSAPAKPPVLNQDPYSEKNLLDPYLWQEEMRELAPVVRLEQYDAYAIGRYAEVNAVLRDPITYDNAAGIGLANLNKPGSWGRKPSVFSEKVGEEHSRNRGVITRIMSPVVIRKWKSDFERQAVEVVDELGDQREIDGVRDIAEAFILKALPGAVGLTITREQMNISADLNFNQLGPNNDLLAAALKRAEPHMEWYNKQMTRDGLVPGGVGAKIYEAADQGLIPEEVAPEMIRAFLRAGMDSTISSISAALRYLAMDSKQWDTLRESPEKARSAFNEATRLESPVSISYRTTTCDTSLSGYAIPADSKVAVWFGSANRDPRKWEDPDKFDLERNTIGHMGFGDGPHVCIGQNIARMEGEVILATLAKRFRRIELDGEPQYKLVNAFHGLKSLPLKLSPA